MRLLIIASALTLASCGGDLASSDSSSTAPAPDPVVDQGETITTADLVVSPDFNFDSQIKVNLQVAADMVNQRAYLSVCKQDAVVLHNDYCFFRGPLTAAGLDRELLLPHREQKLTAHIWFYDGTTEAQTYDWQFNANLEQQILTIN